MINNSEQLLISSVLRDGDIGLALKRGIKPNMFHAYKNEWEWIEKFYLTRSKVPSKAAFVTNFPTFRLKQVNDTEHFADEVRNEHTVTEILTTVQSVVEQAKSKNGAEALNQMFSSSMRISSNLGLVVDGDLFRDYDDVMNDFAIRRERYEKMGASGIPTGFPTFDSRTGGYAPAEFWVVAARLGVGKSYSLQAMATHAATCGYKTLYFALEQPRANVMARVAPLLSAKVGKRKFASRNLIQGHGYDPVEFAEFMSNLKGAVKGNFHVIDTRNGRIGTVDIAAAIERNKPDVVYVDHLTLVERSTQDHMGIAEVANDLTMFANRYDIPIISAAQLNRNGASKDADMDTIGGSDIIGQNASGAIFATKASKRVIKYDVKKARNSEGGFGWWVKFQPDEGAFYEISYDTAQELIEIDEDEAEMEKIENG